jgi:hypothetical protein
MYRIQLNGKINTGLHTHSLFMYRK